MALAIVVVFFMGWGKLLWVDRYIKKQQVVDEEKKMKIQELRDEGHIIASRGNHDIPFGVRAIQSGIQVDGIWISQSATPMQSELKLGHLRSSSSDNVASEDSSKSGQVVVEATPVLPPPKPRVPEFRDQNTLHGGQPELANPPQDVSGPRTSYKPRRSSQLRYGDNGDYDEQTLGHLEGKESPQRNKVYARQPRGSRHTTDNEADSSAADNERNSGTSDDSDATLSQKPRSRPDRPRQSLLSNTTNRDAQPRVSSVVSGKPVQASVPVQSSRAEYVSVPNESPSKEYYDPFMAHNDGAPEVLDSFTQTATPLRSSWFENAPSEPSQPDPPRYISGELHANRAVRKVNSGFELLPAGTFGAPSNLKGKGKEVEVDEGEDSSDRRQSTKLQKRPGNSFSGRRPSSTMDRP